MLGLDLWNVSSYNSLLCLEMPHDVVLVGYAVDVAAVICTRIAELAPDIPESGDDSGQFLDEEPWISAGCS